MIPERIIFVSRGITVSAENALFGNTQAALGSEYQLRADNQPAISYWRIELRHDRLGQLTWLGTAVRHLHKEPTDFWSTSKRQIVNRGYT